MKFNLSYIFLILILPFRLYSSEIPSITFIENKGQWPVIVKFGAEIPGGELYIMDGKIRLAFRDAKALNASNHIGISNGYHTLKKTNELLKMHAFDMVFNDDAPSMVYEKNGQVSGLYNYFIGNDTSKWVKGAHGYTSIKMKDVFSGVDLVFSSSGGNLKYDLIVEAGCSSDDIKIKYEGVDNLLLTDYGIEIVTSIGIFDEFVPETYSICDGKKSMLNCSYVVEGNNVRFDVEDRDVSESLVIDPLLIFSTYSGSAADNWGNTATYDEHGNAYSGGMTNHERGGLFVGVFPVTTGAYQANYGGIWDVAILKFDSLGQNLLYATYLGGTDSEVPQSMIVNQKGQLVILGVTSSLDFPITANAFDSTFNGGSSFDLIGGVPMRNGSDNFVAILSEDGSELLASTYIGGSANDGILPGINELVRNYGDESRGDIITDKEGNIYLISRSYSTDFPTKNGFQMLHRGGVDGTVVKMTPDLSEMVWGTFLGGSGSDTGLSIKLDSANAPFIAGGTSSQDLTTTDSVLHETFNGGTDGWVAHLGSDGDSLLSLSYIGTNVYDQVFFIDIDSEGSVYMAGQTTGDYPVTSGVYRHGTSGQFIHKISGDLQRTEFSTVVSSLEKSIPDISLTAFLVNDCNNIYLSGWGSNINAFRNDTFGYFGLETNGLPVSSDAHQKTTDGSSFYMMVLSGNASEFLYGTFFGDVNSLVHVDGGTSRFDKNGIVYHAVCASCTGDSSFPTTTNVYAENNGSSGCNNAVFKFDLASLRARIQTNTLDFKNPGFNNGCIPLDIAFQNRSIGGEIFEWDFGDGTTISTRDTSTIFYQYSVEGVYNVSLRAFDISACVVEDFDYATVIASYTDFSISNSVDICEGSSTTLSVVGGTNFLWIPNTGLNDPTASTPIATPSDTIAYKVEAWDINGCSFEDSLVVNVIPMPTLTIQKVFPSSCADGNGIQFEVEVEDTENIVWDFGDGILSNDINPFHQFEEEGDYSVEVAVYNNKCNVSNTIPLTVFNTFIPNVITRNNDGLNDTFEVISTIPLGIKIYNRWGRLVFEENSYNNDWSGDGLASGIYYYELINEGGGNCNGWVELLDGIN